jgi:hypothetical protein
MATKFIFKCPPTVTTEAYCVKCKKMVTITAPEMVKYSTGRYALTGHCPHDGQKCFKIISKAKAMLLYPSLSE